MFKKIQGYFQEEETLEACVAFDDTGDPTDEDLVIATIVLMVEMAGSDQEIAREEGNEVVQTVCKEFQIAEDRVPELVKLAVSAKKDAGKIDKFVACINEKFNVAQRQKVLSMLWRVVLADGKVDKFEERLAVQMKFRFQLTEEQAEEAKQMATA